MIIITQVSMNPAYQLVEIEYMLKNTNSKGVLFYDSFKTLQHLNIMNKICPELATSQPGELKSAKLPFLKHVVVINSPLAEAKQSHKGTWSFDLLETGKLGSQTYQMPKVDIDDPFLILFTVSNLYTV
jgi:fatty-acyl-CoA synthase